jgi:7,8-dihydropterin-6-yl-methyl-4-(beta-D-ribofuranosyl)aminobenzene 5'-phosphate synthase
MHPIPDFGTLATASVTVLVDNRADMLAKSTDSVEHWTEQPLLAEHGFAALIELPDAGVRILWDTGFAPGTLLENARRMGVDLSALDAIVLSHGHSDHTGGMTAVLEAMSRLREPRTWSSEVDLQAADIWAQERRLPLVTHPAAFREGWFLDEDDRWHGPMLPLPRATWEELGARVYCSEEPHRLAPGCWTTGYVPRTSFESAGRLSRYYYREGERLIGSEVDDDQALILNLEGKGLVIVSGCAHAGIVNTVTHAQAITGVERVHAVIGGLHLARAEAGEIEQTVQAFKAWAPALVAPSHCTGFGAINRFASEMPGAFVHGLVGTTYRF